MEEDEVIRLEDGRIMCPACVVGEIRTFGGPIGVGIYGAGDPNVLYLCGCDVCSKMYRLKDEEWRQRMIREHNLVDLALVNDDN